jgi:uncharacterized protein with PQ loop repeat
MFNEKPILMINLKSAFLTWLISGLAGVILKIMHYEKLFTFVSFLNFAALILTVVFLVKKIRTIKV